MNEKKGAVFLIHGAYGNPNENWFPWLRGELEKEDIKVYVPKFPTPEGQTLDNWLEVLSGYSDVIDENTIMVGHSIGSAFILNVLERMDKVIKGAFLVAPFIGLLKNPRFDEINKTFTDKDFNWEKIKAKCGIFYVYSSDNDPYVPLEKGKYIAEKLGAIFKIVKGAGHFNESAGYTKFDILLDDIKRVYYGER